jgi:hypothetical protein|nr:MAG TPA: hypothetical protein [Caudoviricetes sp.]
MSIAKSNIIPGVQYQTDSVAYIANMKQSYLYLRNGANLLDILYFNTKADSLVFVFEKNDDLRELYKKWNNHELE